MGANFSLPETINNGDVTDASKVMSNFQTILSNFDPAGMDDASADVAAMRATTDPYPGGVESLATSLLGEIQRLRYMIKQISGESQYYIDPDTDIATIASAYATKASLQSGAATYAETSGTDTYTASLTPTLDAYVTGLTINVLFGNANATTTPTLQIGSLAAITIKRITAAGVTVALNAGDIIANHKAKLWYDGTYFILLNPVYPIPHTHADTKNGGQLTSTGVTSVFGTWDLDTKSAGPAYQAATDLIISAYMSAGTGTGTLTGYSDASNPPTTVILSQNMTDGSEKLAITFPVKKGHYWKIGTSSGNTITINALPVGS